MRLVGHLPNQTSALTFSNYLVRQGITNEVECEDERWAVWVHSEDKWGEAKEEFGEYRGNPTNPRYQTPLARAVATRVREREAGGRREEASESGVTGFGPLTLALTFGAFAIGLVSGWGANMEILSPLFMTSLESVGSTVQWKAGLREVWAGEWWRLVTPIFIHFGWMHLLFNLLWFSGLGSVIETREGTSRLVGLILVLSLVSNVGQYVLEGPNFGGLSGVVYGMVAFVWMRFRMEPASGYYISFGSMTVLMVWYFLCLLEIVPNAANGSHTFGLLAGFACGFVSVRLRRLARARAGRS